MGKISYEKLKSKLSEAGLTTYVIRKNKIVGQSTLYNINHDLPINTDTICKLCEVLNCQPGDLLEYVKE